MRTINKPLEYWQYSLKKNSKVLKENKKWYKSSTFWDERNQDEYAKKLTTARLKRELSVIKKYIKKGPCEVIDVPCGSGRIANRIASKNCFVQGVDSNKKFLLFAKEEADRLGIVKFVKYNLKDFLEYKTKSKFDLVLNIYSSLGYYESEEKNWELIRLLMKLAKVGGTIIIETFNPYKVIKNNSHQTTFKNAKGENVIYTRTYDMNTSVNITKVDKWKEKRHISSYAYCIRNFFPHELSEVARQNSCELVDVLNQKGSRNNLPNSDRLWFIFKKNGKQ